MKDIVILASFYNQDIQATLKEGLRCCVISMQARCVELLMMNKYDETIALIRAIQDVQKYREEETHVHANE